MPLREENPDSLTAEAILTPRPRGQPMVLLKFSVQNQLSTTKVVHLESAGCHIHSL